MLTADSTPAHAPLTDLDIVAIRRSLELQLAEHEDIIRELAPRAAPNVDPIAWATTATTRRVVERIVAALERLSAGTYGRCVRCESAIVAGRLEILPYAETCVACQSQVERS